MSTPKILYIGPLKDFSGYANAARGYVSALDKVGTNLVTRHIKYDSGEYKNSEREEELAQRDTRDVDIVLQHTTPNESQVKEGAFNVLYFAWETDRVPNEWVEKINEMDLVLVPCKENIRAARRSGVIVPMKKIHHAFDKKKYEYEHEPYSIPGLENGFKFLAICQYSKKKGVDPLLKAYLSEFNKEDNVALILKIYIGSADTKDEKNHIQHLVSEMKSILRIQEYSPIILVHDIISDEDINKLYATADCYCLPSRGEGWGIPHFDALGFGLPAIATNWGGPTEFINSDCGWLVDYNMSPVVNMPHPHPFMYTGKDNWAEPHVNHLKACMRRAYDTWKDNKEKWSSMQNAARKRVNDFSYDKIGKEMSDVIIGYYDKWKAANVR